MADSHRAASASGTTELVEERVPGKTSAASAELHVATSLAARPRRTRRNAPDLAAIPRGGMVSERQAMPVTIAFDNSYARLPERMFARVAPTKVAEPRIIKVNHPLAEQLGFDPAQLDSAEGAELLSGNRVPEGAASIALAYAGHQFGGFSPQLGDGRAILLGEVVGRDGARRDIQLKGA